MRPVSAKFLAAVRGSHRAAFRARVLSPGSSGVNPGPLNADGTPTNALLIESGTCTFDRTQQVRATLDLTVSAAWPTSATSLITPYGNEIFVERGITYADTTTEWVSQGYYRINQVEQQSAPFGAVTLTGTDRMQGLIDARLPVPLQFNAGTSVISVIQTLVLDAYPWATFDSDASLSTSTLATSQITTDDRYGFINDLVTSYGMVWYWDHRGILYIHTAPSPTTPIISVSSGSGGVLVSLSRTRNRTGVYNGCVASGEQAADTPPVSALVVDVDPSSPTLWGGNFGKIPQFFSSSFLSTTLQCQSAAASLLMQSTGLPYEVDFSMVPNPALEPLDCVQLTYPGRTEVHVLDQVTVPLDTGTALSATTRQLTTGKFA